MINILKYCLFLIVINTANCQTISSTDTLINSSKNNNLNKLIIYYGDFTFKNSALDMVSLLKKEIKNLNPTVIQVNKKFRVKVATINDISEFDIFFNKIINTKFDNYNIIVE